MRAAIVGSVDGEDVAGGDVAMVLADDGLDRPVHGAEMHRHVRRVGDQRAARGEHRTGEVEPLLDVDRIGGVLQRDAHLLRNGHEQVVEHFQHHRIGGGADRVGAFERYGAGEDDVVLRRHLGLPAVLDDDRLVRLDDDRRAHDGVAGSELIAPEDGGLVPASE
jgi:hypothetical protein